MNLPAWRFDPAQEYHARKDFLSSSMISRGVVSLAHLRAYLDTPSEPTPAMLLGSLIHTATLEPEEFAARYLVAPKVDRRTKEGKAEWDAFQAQAGGREVVSQDDHNTASRCATAVRRHPVAGELLAGCKAESSVYWQDEKTGVLCKARPDAFNPDTGVLLDLKSTTDAGPRFIRDIFSMGYHRQLAFYSMALEAIGFPVSRVVLIAVEKTPPFQVGLFELDAVSLALGAHRVREFLPKYAAAKAADTWPGYPVEIQKVTPPAWAFE